MILIVDCRDSFVYNLVAILRSTGEEVIVMDEDDDRIRNMEPDAVVLSPGPGHPSPDRGSWKAFERFHGIVPVLGVCLGHHQHMHLYRYEGLCPQGRVIDDTPDRPDPIPHVFQERRHGLC